MSHEKRNNKQEGANNDVHSLQVQLSAYLTEIAFKNNKIDTRGWD